MINKSRSLQREKVRTRIHRKIRGTTNRPRLVVYRSLNHVYAQIVDDSTSATLTSASSLSPDLREDLKSVKGMKEKAKRVGILVAKKAGEKKISQVVFDRNGYIYHGIVKSLAEGAREGGLKF